jgi:hypothetical protein
VMSSVTNPVLTPCVIRERLTATARTSSESKADLR